MIGDLTKIAPCELAKYSIAKMFQKKVIIIPKRINRFLLFLQKIIPEKLLQKILLNEFKKEILATEHLNKINNSMLISSSKTKKSNLTNSNKIKLKETSQSVILD